MKSSLYNYLEMLWDDAATPVAIKEEIISRTPLNEGIEKSGLSDSVSSSLDDCKKDQVIRSIIIPENGLMDFMINMCIKSKKCGKKLFPIEDPKELNDSILVETTREIFGDCIGNLTAFWIYIWFCSQE